MSSVNPGLTPFIQRVPALPTVFDRYLLRRYLGVFVILFITTYGLFVVIDGFTNVDAFQQNTESTLVMLGEMGAFYFYNLSAYFDMTAPILAVIAVMVVFGLLQKHSEIAPILAAGIPTYRLLLPFLVGAFVVNGLVMLNQDLVIPSIAHILQSERGEENNAGTKVEPIYDYVTRIRIDGLQLFYADQRIEQANFVLPVPEVANELTTLRASEATFHAAADGRPSGWHLRDVSPSFTELTLTPSGSRIIRRVPRSNDVFVVTDVSFDQLSNRSKSYKYVSTTELVRRIRNPAYGSASVKGQLIHFHSRLVTPIANVLCVFVVVPMIIRRESRSLVTNMALCTLILGVLFAGGQAFVYLAQVNLMTADLSAWGLAISTGTLGAWLTGVVQT